MRWSYLFQHWGLTILLGSLFCLGYFILSDYQSPEDFRWILSKSSVEMMFMFLLFSFLYSIPTYIVYTLFFAFMENSPMSILWKKAILLFIAQVGIWFSFYWISEGWFSDLLPLALFYGIASLGSGLGLKLSKGNNFEV